MLNKPAHKIAVSRSATTNPDSGLGLFAAWAIGKRRVVACYYGSMGCVSLTKTQHREKTYGDGLIQMTAETFSQRANELPAQVMDKGNEQNV